MVSSPSQGEPSPCPSLLQSVGRAGWMAFRCPSDWSVWRELGKRRLCTPLSPHMHRQRRVKGFQPEDCKCFQCPAMSLARSRQSLPRQCLAVGTRRRRRHRGFYPTSWTPHSRGLNLRSPLQPLCHWFLYYPALKALRHHGQGAGMGVRSLGPAWVQPGTNSQDAVGKSPIPSGCCGPLHEARGLGVGPDHLKGPPALPHHALPSRRRKQ